ncbi:hypothetical protein As57867_023243, partial [Aphanomyces stellatus]
MRIRGEGTTVTQPQATSEPPTRGRGAKSVRPSPTAVSTTTHEFEPTTRLPQVQSEESRPTSTVRTAPQPTPSHATTALPRTIDMLSSRRNLQGPTTSSNEDSLNGRQHTTSPSTAEPSRLPTPAPFSSSFSSPSTTPLALSFKEEVSPPIDEAATSALNGTNSTEPSFRVTFLPKTTPLENATDAPLPTPTLSLPPSNTALYTGISVGAVVGVLLFVGCFMRRSRTRSIRSSTKSTTLTSQQSSQTLHWHNLNQHQVNIEDIQLIKRLAAGAYGILYLATYQDQLVAVKTCTKTTLPDIQAFFDELALLATLTSPTIVTLVGVAWTK